MKLKSLGLGGLLFAGKVMVILQLVSLPAMSEDTGKKVLKGVSTEVVVEDLRSHSDKYLDVLKGDKNKRKAYIEAVYGNLNLERLVKAKKLDESPDFLREMAKLKTKVYLDALVISKLEDANLDVSELANERYQFSKEKYKTRKKIKIAVIYLEKKSDDGKSESNKLNEFLEQLQEKKGFERNELFFKLAKEHSEDRKAENGGVNDKWLLAPVDLDKGSDLMKQVFGLEELGDLTEVLETKHGYQIFMLLDFTPGIQQTYADVEKDLVQEIKGELWEKVQAEVTKEVLPSEEVRNSLNDDLLKEILKEVIDIRKMKSNAS